MGQKYEYDEGGVRAEFVFPEPFTGSHWRAMQIALREARDADLDALTVSFLGTLSVVQDAQWNLDGDVKPVDMDAPLEVLLWLDRTVGDLIAERLKVPKD